MTVQQTSSVPRSDELERERESHCTPSLSLNFNSSAAGLRVQPDWISVGVNGEPRRVDVAKLRMA